MWYGATKVGILEIDMDHNNVDLLLMHYFSSPENERYLEQIVQGLLRHFDHEVHVIESLGGEFPQKHRDEHQRLSTFLNKALDEVRLGKRSGHSLAEEIRSLLLLHVVDFDIELTKCIKPRL